MEITGERGNRSLTNELHEAFSRSETPVQQTAMVRYRHRKPRLGRLMQFVVTGAARFADRFLTGAARFAGGGVAEQFPNNFDFSLDGYAAVVHAFLRLIGVDHVFSL